MPANSDQFRRAVIAAGLMSARDIEVFWNSLPGGARPATAEAFAAALVRAGRLTPEQATQLLASLGQSVVIVAPEKSESWTIKLIGGIFATLVAPLLVTYIINRLDNRPDPPAPVPAAAPQAVAPLASVVAPQPNALPAVDSVAMKSQPEPPIVVRAERPIVPAAPADSAKSSAPKPKNDKPAAPVAPKSMGWPADAGKASGTQNDWAKFLKTPVEIDNSLGMKLVLIPQGTFKMGNTEKRRMKVARALKLASELERMHDELPQHGVNFNRGWWLGETEVTIGQFARFVAATKYVTEAERLAADSSKKAGGKPPPNWREPGYEVTNNFPVTHVTWNDAVAFCNWLSENEKLKPCYQRDGDSWSRHRGNNGYRLPTEAQWEYACRAGAAAEFFFGDDPSVLEKFAWYAVNSEHSAKPVGQKRANPWHLRDTHGNVREWCNDFYVADYYADSAPIEPQGPANGVLRVARGGSWYSTAVRSRSGDRDGLAPTYHSNQVGFRVERPL